MEELHGVIDVNWKKFNALKRQALLFDKFHIVRSDRFGLRPREGSTQAERDYEYIRASGLVADISESTFKKIIGSDLDSDDEEAEFQIMLLGKKHNLKPIEVDRFRKRTADSIGADSAPDYVPYRSVSPVSEAWSDYHIRRLARSLRSYTPIETIPIYQTDPTLFTSTTKLSNSLNTRKSLYVNSTVLRIALEEFPTPAANTDWAKIVEFRNDARTSKGHLYQKQWAFRQWLHSLSTSDLSEKEIKEQFEWNLYQYRQAMAQHAITQSTSFVEVYLVTPLEILEHLVTFKWSQIAKGMVSAKKRKIELTQAELSAPGKECAYVYDSWKAFG